MTSTPIAAEQPQILVIGESLIDIVKYPSGQTERVVGGSPANVARGLSRLGEQVGFLTHIATDDDGKRILGQLSDDGVQVLPASFTASATPTATAILRGDGSVDYEFATTWRLPAVADIPIGDLLHIGSYSAFLPFGSEQIDEQVDRTRRAGRIITFDPNIRPALLGSRRRTAARFRELAEQATLVKLSDEDGHWLYPRLTSTELVQRLLKSGPRIVAITRGAEGAIIATPDVAVHVPAVQAHVIDAVGAGDSFMAALVQSVFRSDLCKISGEDLERFGRRSAAAAAMTVGRRGADLPWMNELVL